MQYKVFTTVSFLRDLENISTFYKNKNNIEYSFKLVRKINNITNSLQEFPERFSKIPELSRNSNLNIRQCVCDNYRVIYQIKNGVVYVFTILGENLLNIDKLNI